MEAVVTGVSFLGAGTIIRRSAGQQVEGLTTAASLLFTAGIGACAALSQVVLAVGATILLLITLRVVGFAQSRLDEWLRRVSRQHGEMNDKELALDSQDEDT